MEKEEICQFNLIRINVPQKTIINLYYARRYLTPKERLKISQKLTQIEKEFNKLLHLRSIVEKILLKSPDSRI